MRKFPFFFTAMNADDDQREKDFRNFFALTNIRSYSFTLLFNFKIRIFFLRLFYSYLSLSYDKVHLY